MHGTCRFKSSPRGQTQRCKGQGLTRGPHVQMKRGGGVIHLHALTTTQHHTAFFVGGGTGGCGCKWKDIPHRKLRDSYMGGGGGGTSKKSPFGASTYGTYSPVGTSSELVILPSSPSPAPSFSACSPLSASLRSHKTNHQISSTIHLGLINNTECC